MMRLDEDDAISNAIRRTEEEIFYEGAFGEDVPEDNRLPLDELSMLEGADGGPLPDAEGMYTALHGYRDDGYDRPLALEQIRELEGQLEQMQAERDRANDDLTRVLTSDIVRQQEAGQRQALRDEWRDASDEQIDRYIAGAAQQGAMLRQHQENRVNASMAHAAETYGDDFHQAFGAITRMDPRSPEARAIAHAIYHGDNLGEVVMQTYFGNRVDALAGMPPSLNAANQGLGRNSYRGGAPRGGGGDGMRGGWGDAGTEADIAASVWD
jgi:hypothetical protein